MYLKFMMWIEMVRFCLYSDLVSSLPCGETKWGDRVKRLAARGPWWRKQLVKVLKPTKTYRVYQHRKESKPYLRHVYHYRYCSKDAFVHALLAAQSLPGRNVILQTPTYITSDGTDKFPILRQIPEDSEHFSVVFDTNDLVYQIQKRDSVNADWRVVDVFPHDHPTFPSIVKDVKRRESFSVETIYRLVMRHPNLPEGGSVVWEPDTVQQYPGNYFSGDVLKVTGATYHFEDELVKAPGTDLPSIGEPRLYGLLKFWTRDVIYYMDGTACVTLTKENPHVG